MKNLQKGFISKSLIIIIALVLVAGGSLVYARNNGMIDIFLTSEQKEEREIKRITKLFPDVIGDYTLQIKNTYKVDIRYECDRIEDHPDTKSIEVEGEICGKNALAEYRQSNTNKVVFIHAVTFNQGKDLYIEVLKKMSKSEKLGSYDVQRIENHELGWVPATTFDYIISQEGKWKKESDGESMGYVDPANGNNPVTQYFISTYSPNIALQK